MTDKPNTTVNFRKLLLNRCQKEFEKDKVDDVVFERRQKELDSAASVRDLWISQVWLQIFCCIKASLVQVREWNSEIQLNSGQEVLWITSRATICSTFPWSPQATERERLQEELEDAKDKARRRSIGNIKFIGELFKLKMLTEAIMHDCVVKLLKNHDQESLECLCRLLTTIGKDLDFEKAKVRRRKRFIYEVSQTG